MQALSSRDYLQSKNIELDTLPNGHFAISLSSFASLFTSGEDPEILTGLARDIDAVVIDNQQVFTLFAIAEKYRQAIQQLWFSRDHLVIPSPDVTIERFQTIKDTIRRDIDTVHSFFPNASKICGIRSHQVSKSMIQTLHSQSYGHALRSALLIAEDKIDEAKPEAQTAYEKSALSPFALTLCARLSLDEKNFTASVDLAQNAIQCSWTYSAAYETLGAALLSTARYEEAKAFLETALTMNPKSSVAFTALATLFFERNMLDEAKKMADKALALDRE
ncbi:MAG: tetratricopeptide repeat protein, partial [Verrucomicrobia bacterium]|nr:tetratricopeptide repeat protein [Verrucomicrobiota bacterium]